MTKMKPEIKEAWLKKLRGGELEQCFGGLFDDGKCCAVGALGLVCAEAGLAEIVNKEGKRYSVSAPGEDWGMQTALPAQVCVAIGLDCLAEERVINMNDVDKASFADIATYIETHL